MIYCSFNSLDWSNSILYYKPREHHYSVQCEVGSIKETFLRNVFNHWLHLAHQGTIGALLFQPQLIGNLLVLQSLYLESEGKNIEEARAGS